MENTRSQKIYICNFSASFFFSFLFLLLLFEYFSIRLSAHSFVFSFLCWWKCERWIFFWFELFLPTWKHKTKSPLKCRLTEVHIFAMRIEQYMHVLCTYGRVHFMYGELCTCNCFQHNDIGSYCLSYEYDVIHLALSSAKCTHFSHN